MSLNVPKRPCKTRRLSVGQDITKSKQKVIAVRIIKKNLSSINPPHNDMLQRSRCVYAGFSRHVQHLSEKSNCANRKSEERPLCSPRACESESLAIVRWFLDPQVIAAMPFDEFFSLVTSTKRGIAQKQRLEKIHRLAGESVGCPMGPATEFEAELLVVKLKEVRQQLKQIADDMEVYCIQFSEYKYLLTIPGFGPYIAARVLASISNPWRFNSSNQLLKMAGYDLSAERSGNRSNDAVPVISKRGNAELRWALFQAAQVASTRNVAFMRYFTRLLRGRERERGIKTKMKVKLATKMLKMAWTLMKKQEVFDPVYLINE